MVMHIITLVTIATDQADLNILVYANTDTYKKINEF